MKGLLRLEIVELKTTLNTQFNYLIHSRSVPLKIVELKTIMQGTKFKLKKPNLALVTFARETKFK